VLTIVCDAAPLITACKFVVEGTLIIDHLLSVCRLVIAPRVEEARISSNVMAAPPLVQKE
jgi:hypothetical protein